MLQAYCQGHLQRKTKERKDMVQFLPVVFCFFFGEGGVRVRVRVRVRLVQVRGRGGGVRLRLRVRVRVRARFFFLGGGFGSGLGFGQGSLCLFLGGRDGAFSFFDSKTLFSRLWVGTGKRNRRKIASDFLSRGKEIAAFPRFQIAAFSGR